MVAFATDYEPGTATVTSENRVGDFFVDVPDRAGWTGSATRTVAGENDRFSYGACRSASLAQGRNRNALGRAKNRGIIATPVGDFFSDAGKLTYEVAGAAGQGAWAFADGALDLIPLVEIKPFETLGLYDSSQYGLGWSQAIGGGTRDIGLMASGFGFYRAAGGATTSVSRTLFAAEFGPSVPNLLFSVGNPLSTGNIVANYLLKWAGRFETYSNFRNAAEGGDSNP